jgi:hypothetical protein
MENFIENKVAKSGLITIDLIDFLAEKPIEVIDIANQLWQGLALKEQDFREFLKTNNWAQFQGKYVGVYCSADAIIPHWAYMLVASALQPYAELVLFGDVNQVKQSIILNEVNNLISSEFENSRVIIKGCGELDLNPDVYLAITQKLQPVAKSIMYGEPCSTVPIYKQPKP